MSVSPKVYAELELGLHRVQNDAYQIEFRFIDADSDNQAEIAPERQQTALDLDVLLTVQHDPESYGKTLTGQLFEHEDTRLLWAKIKTAVETNDQPLRLRLLIGLSAPELHGVRWELLQDPQTHTPLATSERVLFSRFMLSQDWRPIKIQPKTELRALIAIAAPSNLAEYDLAEVDLEGQLGLARDSLQDIHTQVIGRDQPLTLEALIDGLRQEQGVDIFYLVCHGALTRQGQSILYLQDSAGAVQVAKGAELAQRITELPHPPRLAVLASCESAAVATDISSDKENQATPAALAPLLAGAGVPAVLAMQGQISMETVAQSLPVFFQELLKDGQIDRALAVARGLVRHNSDSWMPALYLRLKRGRIWYVPGFADDEADFEKWKSICHHVRQGNFIPIIGPEVGEHIYDYRQLSENLAKKHGFPLEAYYNSDLAKVTQYVSIHQDGKYTRETVQNQLNQQVKARYSSLLEKPGNTKLSVAVLQDRKDDPDDPFRILAELKASIYVTASTERILDRMIDAFGAEPSQLLCEWRSSNPVEPQYDSVPSPEKPIIYHVFGAFDKPSSLVLTEDDFFDFLIASATYKLMPTAVRGSLMENSLLFLGFSLNTWTFRVLFRLIMSLEGRTALRDFSHVGVQVEPGESSLADVEGARDYLDKYFGNDRSNPSEPKIDIYWGSAADFLKELRDKLQEFADEDPSASSEEEDEDDGFF